jgi:hypothetical protein
MNQSRFLDQLTSGTLTNITTSGNITQTRNGFPATNSFKSTTGGSQLFIDRAGTSNESSISFITGSTLDFQLGCDNSPAASSSDFTIKRDNNGAADFIILNTNGNVGIGISDPSDKLVVGGNLNVQGIIYSGTLNAGGDILFSGKMNAVTTTSGIILPRLSAAQISSVSSPTAGEILYNTNTNTVQFYNGSELASI